MHLTINSRDFNIHGDLYAITEKRIKKLEKFFDDTANVAVLFKKKRDREIAEITVDHKGTFFRSEVESNTFNNALDEAIDLIVRQIRKNKTKLERTLRTGAFTQFDAEMDLDEPESNIRTKTFPVKPMSVEEAILQMELLEHMFFVFRNAENEEVCVVYKRKDGGYGLILPQ
ncbi:MAG: ribosome-associated translation inhibitor RaiA [Clostridia bacterium]|nr:ribosome-associated translation inhibitor RaiA [Clostridia bacterium]